MGVRIGKSNDLVDVQSWRNIFDLLLNGQERDAAHRIFGNDLMPNAMVEKRFQEPQVVVCSVMSLFGALPERSEVVCNSAEAHLLRRVKSHKTVATIPKPVPTRQTPCHPE